MEVPESPTRADQKHHRSTEHVVETQRRRREYYLRPVLDALEAAVTPCQWRKQKNQLFEINLAQLESFAAIVSFELVLSSLGLFANVVADQMTCFQVLS